MKQLFNLLLTLTLFISPCLVFANGFAINEQGSKAVGMGGAFTAVADDPSAVYFNPAAITKLEGTQFTLGVSPITPYASFDETGGGTHSNEVKTFFIPNFFYTQEITDNVSAGFGVYSNFGLATAWEDDSPTRYLVGGRNAHIETLSINPVIAYQVNEKFSIAGGPFVRFVRANIENNFQIPNTSGKDADIWLKDLEDEAVGWSFGTFYEPTEKLSLGLTYKSGTKHVLIGQSKMYNVDTVGTPGAALPVVAYISNKYNQDISATLYLPAIAQGGVAYKITDKFTMAFDAQWTEWSTYRSLKSTELGLEKAKDWKDAWTLRLGGSYDLTDVYQLRAGIVRDYSPIPEDTIDPMLPSGDRWLYAVGVGADYGRFTVDFAYNYLHDKGGDFNNEAGNVTNPIVGNSHVSGTFEDVYAHIFSVNVGFKF